MEIGWRVPSYARKWTKVSDSRKLVSYFKSVEENNFKSLWVIDHLLIAPNVYSAAWQDPLITLAVAGAVTEKITLGTAILCAPMRHPVITAKEIASIEHYSGGGRLILGIGTGHDELEFQSVGVSKRERGKRTDEALEVIRRLLSEDKVYHDGKFYPIDGISIYPRPERKIPIWIGGGSQVHVVDNPDQPIMVPAVLERIVSHEGWICRSSGTSPEIVKRDVQTVLERIKQKRSIKDFTVAHAQWLHIVDSTNRELVIKEQLEAYRTVMDVKRSDEDLRSAYLFGTIDEMIERIRSIKGTGIEHLIINPLTEDPLQIELFAKEIRPNL